VPREAIYRGLSLWSGVLYSACVELQCFTDEIDFENQEHQSCLNKWFAIGRSTVDQVYSEISENRPLAVVVFQGHFISEHVLRQAAIKEGISVYAVERTARKDRLLFESISGVTVNRNMARNYYWRYLDSLPEKDAGEYCKSLIAGTKTHKQAQHMSPDRVFDTEGSKKVLLFLGQVYTDSSLLFGMVGYQNPIAVFEDVIKWCDQNDYLPVFKLHPKEHSGHDPIFSRDYEQLTFRKWQTATDVNHRVEKGSVVVDEDNRYDTYSMIKKADLVVTINSQAGLEAAIRGKAVVVNSGAFYSSLGFTHDYQSRRTLHAALDDAAEVSLDGSGTRKDAAEKFMFTFYEHCCLEFSPRVLVRRIMDLTRASRS